MPPALLADPISPSTIERRLRPPQRSLSRGDTGVHCFSFESFIVYRSSATIASIFRRPRPALGMAERRACRTHGVGVSAARLRGLRDRRPCGRSRRRGRRPAAGLPGPLPFSFYASLRSAGVAGAAGAGFVLVRSLNPPSSLLDLPLI